MNSLHLLSLLLLLTITASDFPSFATATPRILALVKPTPIVLKYHNGQLLNDNITVNLIWYGKFNPAQKSIIVDFLSSFNGHTPRPPSVVSWWSTIGKYKGGPRTISVGKQISDERCSLGKSLKDDQIVALAKKPGVGPNSINVVLTSDDVGVHEFCMSRCGTHGYTRVNNSGKQLVFAWVGNSETQCPGQCAWPFHKPIVGPQTKPLVAPNGDVGVDGVVINLATVLAGAVTNPSDRGYFQGPATAPLEAVTACTGTFGSGAYPGYPGKVLVDERTRASYNAAGDNGRKYLLPAMWDPTTFTCRPLV